MVRREYFGRYQANADFCFRPIADVSAAGDESAMSPHSYIRVDWLHSSSDEPIELWSELNADREEVRKVESWADGRVGYASLDREAGGTRLGEGPVPPLREIAADPQFRPQTITQSEFEECWRANVC